MNVGAEGQQKGAHELTVGNPERAARIPALEREHIDKDGARPGEEDVERCGVLEDEPTLQRLFAEIECQRCSIDPLAGRPLPGIGGKEDGLVLKQHRLSGRGRENRGDRHAPLFHPALRQGRAKPVQGRRRLLRVDLAKDAASIAVEPARRVTESALWTQRTRTHTLTAFSRFDAERKVKLRKNAFRRLRSMKIMPAKVVVMICRAKIPEPGSTYARAGRATAESATRIRTAVKK